MSREKAQLFLTESLNIDFPYVSMGKIDSLDLFGPTELMILQLYRDNRDRWKNVADIGANLGLHSILMARLGWSVDAYEPDPEIYGKLRDNLDANRMSKMVTAHRVAVHNETTTANFVRVHNNLTGSHLEGYKDSYGPRNTIKVQTIDCREIWPKVDFAKIDSEGNEAALCLTMTAATMEKLDCVMEVRNEENALIIFSYFQDIGVPIWAQKIGWKRVKDASEMPHINREGSIFVGMEPPWR